MSSQWYYSHDESKIGPYSERQLKASAASGGILTTDTIWKEGLARGVLASKVKNLFPPGYVDASFTPAIAGTTLGDQAPLVDGDTELKAHEKTGTSLTIVEQKHDSKGRAVGMKGVLIMSQNGEMVCYKNQCVKCGMIDVCIHSMPITSGVVRKYFFCAKCRKAVEVVLQFIR